MGLTTMAGGATGAGAVGPPFSARKRRTGSALYLRDGWRREETALAQKWRVLVVAAPTKAGIFVAWGGPATTVTPITGRAAFSL